MLGTWNHIFRLTIIVVGLDYKFLLKLFNGVKIVCEEVICVGTQSLPTPPEGRPARLEITKQTNISGLQSWNKDGRECWLQGTENITAHNTGKPN